MFSGESSSVSRHWCVMSGRASEISRPILASTFWWSSQFSSAYFSPASLLPRACVALPLDALYVSRHACSSTTMRRGCDSFSVCVLGSLGAIGTSDGPTRVRLEDAVAIVCRSKDAGVWGGAVAESRDFFDVLSPASVSSSASFSPWSASFSLGVSGISSSGPAVSRYALRNAANERVARGCRFSGCGIAPPIGLCAAGALMVVRAPSSSDEK